MLTSRRLAAVLPMLVLVALALPSSAFGQATRTWVSGVGDDVNPCSRTAPCKTFPGAISKTANGGEINIIDAGPFGTLSINKSITVRARGFTAGMLAFAGINGITINAQPTDKITLKGLDIFGAGTGARGSLTGVKILSAKSVKIKNVDISRFQVGVGLIPTSLQTRVVVSDSDLFDNGIGVFAGPGANTAAIGPRVTLRNNDITDNVCGVVVSSFGSNSGTNPNSATNCGAAASGSGISRGVAIHAYRNLISDNTTGVFSRGGFADAIIGANEISGNDDAGLFRLDAGAIKSFGNNHIFDNGPNHMAPSLVTNTG